MSGVSGCITRPGVYETAFGGTLRELIELAESLGPAFAGRAARHDREASFPFDNYADLRRAGLLGLLNRPLRQANPGIDLSLRVPPLVL